MPTKIKKNYLHFCEMSVWWYNQEGEKEKQEKTVFSPCILIQCEEDFHILTSIILQ